MAALKIVAAITAVQNTDDLANEPQTGVKIYPVPFQNEFYINLNNEKVRQMWYSICWGR